MCHVKDEILTIIDHAGKTLQVCVNKTLGSLDDLTRERLLVAIDDLKTVPGLIIQLQTGKKTGRRSSFPEKFEKIKTSSAHHKRSYRGKKL